MKFTTKIKMNHSTKKLTDEIVRKSDHTLTLQKGKILRKCDLALKTDKISTPRRPVSLRSK